MKIVLVGFTLFAAASTAAFQPSHTKNTAIGFDRSKILFSTLKRDENNLKAKINMERLKASLPDMSSLGKKSDTFVDNTLHGGEAGNRGEAYVLAQLLVVTLIAFGHVPFFGHALDIILGPGFTVVGAAVLVAGVTQMGSSLSPWPVPVPQKNKLITTGIFSKIRHPIYAGLLAACVGLSIETHSPTRLLLTAVLWYVLQLKSDYEEVLLQDVHPEYKEYMTQVKGKFFPHPDSRSWDNKEDGTGIFLKTESTGSFLKSDLTGSLKTDSIGSMKTDPAGSLKTALEPETFSNYTKTQNFNN